MTFRDDDVKTTDEDVGNIGLQDFKEMSFFRYLSHQIHPEGALHLITSLHILTTRAEFHPSWTSEKGHRIRSMGKNSLARFG
jgi:hypothetical protein